MTLVFVCLTGDTAAHDARTFALRLAQRLGSHAFIEAEAPDHHEVALRVREAPGPVGVLIFGHDGGGALRARSLEDPQAVDWATPEQLAAMFPAATVYAFACDTMGSLHIEEVEALGHATVQAGVGSFLGHCCLVSAAAAEDPDPVVDAFAGMLAAYFTGQRHSPTLRSLLEAQFDAIDALATQGIAALFSVSIALRSAIRGLRLAP